MKQFLVALFILGNLNGIAQNGNAADDFTGHKGIETGKEKLSNTAYLNSKVACEVVRINGNADTTITLYIFFKPDQKSVYDEASKLQLVFSDGTIVKFKNQGKTKKYGKGDVATLQTAVNDNARNIIAGNKLSKITIETAGNTIGYDIPDDFSSVIRDQLTRITKPDEK